MKLVKQSQIFGEIYCVNPSEGVVVKVKEGSEHKLPPDLSLLQSPPPDEYTLQSTGEIIVNPDLMTMWTLKSLTLPYRIIAPLTGREGSQEHTG